MNPPASSQGKAIITGQHLDGPSQKTPPWVLGSGRLMNHLVNPCSSFSARHAALSEYLWLRSQRDPSGLKAMTYGRPPEFQSSCPAPFYGVMKRKASVCVSIIKLYFGYTLLSAALSAGRHNWCEAVGPFFFLGCTHPAAAQG